MLEDPEVNQLADSDHSSHSAEYPEVNQLADSDHSSHSARRAILGLNPSNAIFPLLKENCIWRTTRPCDGLDRWMRAERALRGKNMDVLQFISPLKAQVRHTWLQSLLLALSGFHLYSACSTYIGLQSYGALRFSTFRLDVNAMGSNSTSGNSHRREMTIELRLLRKGCAIMSQQLFWSGHDHASAVPLVSLSSPVVPDGFAIVADTSDITGYVLLGSNDEGRTWTVAGSSSFRFISKGVRISNREFVPTREAVFDLRPPWPLILDAIVDSFIFSLGCLGTAVCGALKRFDAAEWVFFWCTLALGLNSLGAGVGYLSIERPMEAFLPFISSVIYLLLCAAWSTAKRFFFDTMAVLSVLGIIGRAANDCSLFLDCEFFAVQPPLGAISFAAIGCIFIARRHHFLIRALRAVAHDRERLDVVWAEVIASEAESLKRLETVTMRLADEYGGERAQARHLMHSRVALSNQLGSNLGAGGRSIGASLTSFYRSHSAESVVWGKEEENTALAGSSMGTPVCSLDQLYAQVQCLAPALHARCSEWAASSSGVVVGERCELALDTRDFECLPPSLRHWARAGTVKAPSRAIEKAIVCYGGDASRVVDLCRGRIVFDSVADLLECLEVVFSQAEEIRVVRVKSSMLADYDSWTSAGFRGVVLNVRIDTEETRMLRVAHHVCEVQLVLRRMLDTEFSVAAHVRFQHFRAVRAYARPFHHMRNRDVAREGHRDSRRDANVPKRDTGMNSLRTAMHYEPESSEIFCEQYEDEDPQICDAHAMYTGYLNAVSSPGGFLEHTACKLQDAFALSSSTSAWFSRNPIAASAGKPATQCFQFMFALFFLYRGVQAVKSLSPPYSFEADVMRFTPLMLRNRELHPSLVNVTSFGPLRDGCRFVVPGTTSTWKGNAYEILFDSRIHADGYYFVTSAGNVELDPILWAVESKTNDSLAWAPVGQGRSLPFATTTVRGAQVDFDSRPSWHTVLIFSIGTFDVTFALLCCIAAARNGRVFWVKRIQVVAMAWGMLALALSAFGFIGQGDIQGAVTVCLIEVTTSIVAIGLAFYESQLPQVLLIYAVCHTIMSLVFCFQFYSLSKEATMNRMLSSPAMASTLVASILLIFRRRAISRARNLLVQDKVRYDDLWTRITADTAMQAGLLELHAAINTLTAAASAHLVDPPRQYNRQRPVAVLVTASLESASLLSRPTFEEGSENEDGFGVAGTQDPARPVTSLDQLFIQAHLLHQMLIARVKDWAAGCGGCFPVVASAAGPELFVRFDEAQTLQMKFCRIKSVSRTVEKVYRSYSQDVSRVVDLCRQAIVLETPGGIASCLRLITADGEVQVVRIKNRYSADYDVGRDVSGYRDVALNVRLVGERARALGLENHVCEVQLILRRFAELKSRDGHKRYVTFRNLRGE